MRTAGGPDPGPSPASAPDFIPVFKTQSNPVRILEKFLSDQYHNKYEQTTLAMYNNQQDCPTHSAAMVLEHVCDGWRCHPPMLTALCFKCCYKYHNLP